MCCFRKNGRDAPLPLFIQWYAEATSFSGLVFGADPDYTIAISP